MKDFAHRVCLVAPAVTRLLVYSCASVSVFALVKRAREFRLTIDRFIIVRKATASLKQLDVYVIRPRIISTPLRICYPLLFSNMTRYLLFLYDISQVVYCVLHTLNEIQ